MKHDLETVIHSLPKGKINLLIGYGILTISDLAKESRSSLANIPGVGLATLRKCDELLKSYGLPPLSLE
jgi:hypothetical protein